MLDGRDTIGQAQSGTGKTATFVIRSFQRIDSSLNACQALILALTRELAQQIHKVVLALGDYLNVRCHACLSTAPVAEPTVMLFAVPLSVSIIAATATAMTTCLSSADCSDSAAPMCSVDVCVAMSCGDGSFSPDGAYDSLWDSVKPMKGKYIINCFQHQEDVGFVCVLNDWINSNDEICADNYNYFRFKLKGNGRSEFWEVYLYGVKTINVDRDRTQVLPRRVPPPSIGDVGFGPSPKLARITPSTS